MSDPIKLHVEFKVEDQYTVIETDSVLITETLISLSSLNENAKRLASINQSSDQSPLVFPNKLGHLTIRDANWEFGLSKSYLRQLCKLGKVDAVKVSGIWHINYESLITHIYKTLLISIQNGGMKLELPERSSSLYFNEEAKQLRRILANHFDAGELRDLCFELGVDFEQIAGRHKGEKALELVALAVRNNYLEQLRQMVKKLRPNLDWQEESEHLV